MKIHDANLGGVTCPCDVKHIFPIIVYIHVSNTSSLSTTSGGMNRAKALHKQVHIPLPNDGTNWQALNSHW